MGKNPYKSVDSKYFRYRLHEARISISQDSKKWNSLVGTDTRMEAGQPRNHSLPGGIREFSLLQSVQTGSDDHPSSYSVDM